MGTDLILHPGPVALLTGLLLGVLASLVHRRLVELSISNAIKRHDKAKISFLAGSVLRIALLAMPLLIGTVFPRYVSVLTAFLGLMSVKLYLFFREIVKEKRR